jgi:hypothetical protein
MLQEIEIMCINKTDRSSAHDRIKSIGGVNPDGKPWKLTVAEAIAGIEAGKWQFYVKQGGLKVWVIIFVTREAHKYLKTENDGEQPNNLLSLPECP